MTEVFAPTSLLPRVIVSVIMVGLVSGALCYLFVSHVEIFGAPPMALCMNLLFIYISVYAVYLLYHPTRGSGNGPANNDQPHVLPPANQGKGDKPPCGGAASD
jgi:hypothetical protein